jgi:hypothetical protein
MEPLGRDAELVGELERDRDPSRYVRAEGIIAALAGQIG